MEIIIIIQIEKNNDDSFSAYALSDYCITGGGQTIDECKQSIVDCINTIKMFDHPPVFVFKSYYLIFLTN